MPEPVVLVLALLMPESVALVLPLFLASNPGILPVLPPVI
jgi:hypothetical protein